MKWKRCDPRQYRRKRPRGHDSPQGLFVESASRACSSHPADEGLVDGGWTAQKCSSIRSDALCHLRPPVEVQADDSLSTFSRIGFPQVSASIAITIPLTIPTLGVVRAMSEWL